MFSYICVVFLKYFSVILCKVFVIKVDLVMKWMKVVLFIGVLLVGYLGMKGIEVFVFDNIIIEEVDICLMVIIEVLLLEDVCV